MLNGVRIIFIAMGLLVSCMSYAQERDELYQQDAEKIRKLLPDEKAREIFPNVLERARNGEAKAQEMLGSMYTFGVGTEQDDKKALYWMRKSADQGRAQAQHNLGVMYERGRCASRNDRQAAFWYGKAAEQGLATAQFNLGNLYAAGRGVTQDKEQAAYWYKKAADQGHVQAEAQLKHLKGYSFFGLW